MIKRPEHYLTKQRWYRVMNTIKLICSTLILIASSSVYADAINSDMNKDIRRMQHEWAQIKYTEKNNDVQEKKIAALSKEAVDIAGRYPTAAEPKIWAAIIVSTQAGIEGGLGALGLVTQAKELLEAAQKINPNALSGSAYTSLGSLYYQVPGWPLGFGDDDKAKANLEQARVLNPKGIDPNYFYGDFLLDQGEYAEAIKIFKVALLAPARPQRPVADAGRRDEIKVGIAKAKEYLEDD